MLQNELCAFELQANVGHQPIDRWPVGMIAELKARKPLEGFRGALSGDILALADAAVAFARTAETIGDRLKEAEINPLFVLPHGVKAADGLVLLT